MVCLYLNICDVNIVIIDYTDIADYFNVVISTICCLAGGGSPDQLVKSVKQACRSVRQVKSDIQTLRALHSRQLQTFEHFMKYSCSQIMSHIKTANLNNSKCNRHVAGTVYYQ